MPIYDYECPKCKTVKEVYKSSYKNKEPVICDKCKIECNKIISSNIKLTDEFKYDKMEIN